jgi:hypothetical protein
MTGLEEVRQTWVRRGVVGHCPLCHHRDWEDQGEVALRTDNGGLVPIVAIALLCPNCGLLITVKRSE